MVYPPFADAVARLRPPARGPGRTSAHPDPPATVPEHDARPKAPPAPRFSPRPGGRRGDRPGKRRVLDFRRRSSPARRRAQRHRAILGVAGGASLLSTATGALVPRFGGRHVFTTAVAVEAISLPAGPGTGLYDRGPHLGGAVRRVLQRRRRDRGAVECAAVCRAAIARPDPSPAVIWGFPNCRVQWALLLAPLRISSARSGLTGKSFFPLTSYADCFQRMGRDRAGAR